MSRRKEQGRRAGEFRPTERMAPRADLSKDSTRKCGVCDRVTDDCRSATVRELDEDDAVLRRYVTVVCRRCRFGETGKKKP
jgi:hypothetical protein